jgi:hypothetical protein
MKHIQKIAAAVSIMIFCQVQAVAYESIRNIFSINGGMSYANTGGRIIDIEKKMPAFISTTDINGANPAGPYLLSRPKHSSMSYGAFGDLTPVPAIVLGNDTHAVKFGIRGGYRYLSVKQKLEVKRLSYTNDLMASHSWSMGPVIKYSPFLITDPVTGAARSRFCITMFFQAGQTFRGYVRPHNAQLNLIKSISSAYWSFSGIYPGLATNWFTNNITGYMTVFGGARSRFSAIKYDIGLGAEAGILLFNLGINIYYSQIDMKIPGNIYWYSCKNTSLRQFNAEFYIGMPVEWPISIKP